jgi:hypothetical protein
MAAGDFNSFTCCSIDGFAAKSMDVKTSKGARVEVANLNTPITFRIQSSNHKQENARSFLICKFFDLDADAWSSEGCWTVSEDDEGITCACNHLSTFTVAVGNMWLAAQQEFFQAVKCATINVLSPGTLSRIFEAEWIFSPASAFLWIVVVSHVLLLIMAVMAARQQVRGEGQIRNVIKRITRRLTQASCGRGDGQKRGGMKVGDAVREKVQNTLVKGITRNYVSYHMKETPVMKATNSRNGTGIASQNTDGLMADEDCDATAECALRTAKNGVRKWMTHGWIGLVAINFVYMHPLLRIYVHGVTRSTPKLVLLHAVRFLATMMVTALFFHADGQGLSYDSDAACSQDHRYDRAVLRKIMIGLLSAPFASFLVMVLKRGVRASTRHDKDVKKNRRSQSALTWAVGSVYSVACVAFLMGFLANVSKKDHWDFVVCCCYRLIIEFVVLPGYLSVALASIAWIVMKMTASNEKNDQDVHGFMFSFIHVKTDDSASEQQLTGTAALHGRQQSATGAAE